MEPPPVLGDSLILAGAPGNGLRPAIGLGTVVGAGGMVEGAVGGSGARGIAGAIKGAVDGFNTTGCPKLGVGIGALGVDGIPIGCWVVIAVLGGGVVAA